VQASEDVAQELIEVEAPPNKPDTSPRWNLKRGQEIDRSLVVIDHLGTGSRYEAYRAWDRELFCEVAVKLIRPHRVEDDRAIEGFEREVTIGSRLGHPNLVRMLRWTAKPPRPYLVMEYVSAPTVGDHLSQTGPVSVPEICLLGIRVASALHHMHNNSVLHLDVKPYNVTMGDPPKLLDLSLARTISGPMRLHHSLGTGPYMAPEQCNHGIVTPQTDLFGLGATLYEAIGGMQAFPHGDDESKVREERFPQLEVEAPPLTDIQNVPAALSRIVMACVDRDPAKRPHSAIDVAVALHGVLEGFALNELYAWPKGLRIRV
jgi:eukaryotic-like serine/threonine-protein kinase